MHPILKAASCAAVLLVITPAEAHSGRTNSAGCHNNPVMTYAYRFDLNSSELNSEKAQIYLDTALKRDGCKGLSDAIKDGASYQYIYYSNDRVLIATIILDKEACGFS